ncbi:N-acetylmuramoyl-L-alanine amidase [Streptomyces massasporeus]|uniref:peptidoglycan recognition protein family protein n=1 Tax=Streptomyces massasporeus TaxID=67324 RepID=UPI0036B878C5
MATPLTADRLVAALRAEGVTVREVPGWRDHNRNHKGAWGPVHGVLIHHTVTGLGTDVVGLIYNGHSALPGPLATGCITKDGVVHLTANGRANHAGGGDGAVLNAVITESYSDRPPAPREHDGSAGAVDGNARFYGWECENKGDGKDPWPKVQYGAMVRATAAICRAHGWGPKSGIGHMEWSDWKVDPRGFDMKDFRAAVAERLEHEPGWSPGEEDDMPTANEVAEAVLKLDGVIVVPGAPKTNPTWTLSSVQTEILKRLDRANTALVAQSAAITKLAGLVGEDVDTATVVAAVEQAIADAVVKVSVEVSDGTKGA